MAPNHRHIQFSLGDKTKLHEILVPDVMQGLYSDFHVVLTVDSDGKCEWGSEKGRGQSEPG